MSFALHFGTFLFLAGLSYLAITGIFYSFAPARAVMRVRGIEPAPVAPVATPRAYRDAKGRWRDSHTNRFCKAPAFA